MQWRTEFDYWDFNFVEFPINYTCWICIYISILVREKTILRNRNLNTSDSAEILYNNRMKLTLPIRKIDEILWVLYKYIDIKTPSPEQGRKYTSIRVRTATSTLMQNLINCPILLKNLLFDIFLQWNSPLSEYSQRKKAETITECTFVFIKTPFSWIRSWRGKGFTQALRILARAGWILY